MEIALQVDLARPEVPADQVLGSALGQISSDHSQHQPGVKSNRLSNDGTKRSPRGRIDITNQVRLVPKPSQVRRSRSTSTQKAPAEKLELGDFDSMANSYTLQPVEGGFGAWSTLRLLLLCSSLFG